ncbi:helix-turn-helix domain-containing protein [Bacillus sp. ISL-57]|uniref:helix-turn-helix domain-containing protein n=1 Tax=Bacillus sp. ISL-57 TaxID=2819135 RepID=UPI001BEA00D9|nr:helix-turn-helix transcriptional regulator [Bacillus sp. ISL-57]MBT2718302.1 helix-turn-helix transcriptional regulator [Bacillus sp. ISL-57]
MINEKETNYRHTEEFRKRFGERLRDLRTKRGHSIEQAHKALNKPRSTYAGWELGKRVPLSKSLNDLAEFLETNVDYLMLNTDNPNQDSKKDLKDVLVDEVDEIVFEGKSLTHDQRSTIAALIEAYLKNGEK